MSVFDISEFQPDDRVQSLNGQGADGIIVKIGEAMELDPKFVRFVNNCAACGLPYGIYYVSHARNADEMMQEAQWINDTIYSYLGGNNIMGPLSRPRSKILRVAVSRIILSSEASKVKLVGNLVA